MPVAREVRCTVCSKEGAAVLACDNREECKLVALPPRFNVFDQVSVRHNRHVWEVESIDLSRGALGAHRYHLSRIVDYTGPAKQPRKEHTQAYAADLTLLPAAQPAPELSLAPDPPAPYSPAQELRPAAPDAAAPASPGTVAGTVCSPGAGITLNEGMPDGTFGGELDEYSPGAQETNFSLPEKDPEFRPRVKEIRYYPAVALLYRDLKNIIYNAPIKGMEKGPFNELDNDTPVAVAVTKETNGAAVWVITVRDQGEVRECQLEVFFPADRIQQGPGCEAMAIEHGVLLALRKVSIRRNDLEIMILQYE